MAPGRGLSPALGVDKRAVGQGSRIGPSTNPWTARARPGRCRALTHKPSHILARGLYPDVPKLHSVSVLPTREVIKGKPGPARSAAVKLSAWGARCHVASRGLNPGPGGLRNQALCTHAQNPDGEEIVEGKDGSVPCPMGRLSLKYTYSLVMGGKGEDQQAMWRLRGWAPCGQCQASSPGPGSLKITLGVCECLCSKS